jgi:hypothetical protein
MWHEMSHTVKETIVKVKGIDLDPVPDLHVFSTPEYEKTFFGMPPVGTCSPLVLERMNEFYEYSILDNLSIIGQCPVNMNTLAQKIWAFKMRPPPPQRNQRPFSQNGPNDFDHI